jgi:hypothetical protein
MFRTSLLIALTAAFLGCKDKSEPEDTGDPGVDPVDADGDGFAEEDDCDDSNAAINPDADEVCDSVDNNCDGDVDEGVTSTFYADGDGDGFGDIDSSTDACAAPSGYTADDTDCDDTRLDINPDADEVCDEADNNCDGEIDEDTATDATTWYADVDSDGYGDDKDAIVSCTAPKGYIEQGGDCDDSDGAYNPGAEESDCADPNDYNCDGSVGYADDDGDGWAACEECDDSDKSINPDGTEICDGADNDCDGDIDEDDAIDAGTWYGDGDGDGYGDAATTTLACEAPSGYVANDTDCDDADADQFPGADEYCNAEDDDCDGTVDEDDAIDASTWYADTDGDFFGDASSTTAACLKPTGYVADDTDCDDSDVTVNPDAIEECDTVDNDCDGTVDEDDAIDADTWYRDADSDGFGNLDNTTISCDQPTGYLADSTDCNDANNSINPDADEECDSVDNDCDGDTDEDDAIDADTWYRDADTDGYGDTSVTAVSCSSPSGYVGNDDDCDDSDSSISPAATEVCDEIDNDCDGDIDDDDSNLDASTTMTWYSDVDGDGYGSTTFTLDRCAQPTNYVADDTDCDDSDADVYPGAPDEVYHDGVDQDCDDFDGYTIDYLIAGDLIITEIMANPDAVTDANGEYFEFYNASGVDVNIDGLVFTDNSSSDTVEETLVIDADSYAVFAINGNYSSNGGIDADFDWSGPALSNSGDVITLSYDGTTFDEVNYSGWTVTAGVSMSLDPSADATDNDDEAFWCEATTTYGDGDYGTPGDENDECPVETYNVGNDVEFSGSGNLAANYLLGSPLNVPDDVTIDMFSVIVKSGSGNFKMALYSDSGGAPDALVAETGSTAISGSGTYSFDITDVAITAGDYWIMMLSDTSSIYLAYTTSTTETVAYINHSFSSSLPDPFGTASTYTGQEFNIYLTVY